MKLPVAVTMLIICMPLVAEDEPAPQPPCSMEKYHQFDFWIGDWNVIENGHPAGSNSIQSIDNGCALLEHWQGAGPGGISGSSLNIYDRVRDRWHQTWVDGEGTLLVLEGGWRDGSMVLQGERPAVDGNGATTHRITWTPNEDGTVRQLWDASRDGKSWIVLFDGLYEKAPASP